MDEDFKHFKVAISYTNNSLDRLFVSRENKKQLSENYDVPGHGLDNTNQDMNVVVNTDSSGSEVTVTISTGKKDQSMEHNNRVVYDHNHVENYNILKQVRDLLVSQKLEKNGKKNKSILAKEKNTISDMIKDLNVITKRYMNMTKKGNEETGFFGLLKTKSRVYPIVMGEAGRKMAHNTTIIQENLTSPNRTKNMLLNEFAKISSKGSNLPLNLLLGRKKMITLFQRLKGKDKKGINNTVPFKFNGLPVLQNIRTTTTIPKTSKHALTNP